MNSKQYKIIQEYSSAVDRVNRSIGGKSVLYANNVLSKDPNAGGGFSKLLNGESIPSISYTRHVAHLGEYFFKSFVFISLWACKKALFNTVGQTSKKAQNLHIVDIFALSQNISKSEEFHDRYLQKLVETLYENGINYSYLLRFYQDGYNPVKWYKVYKTLRKSRHSFITEFDLLSWTDILKMFVFTVQYPISVLRLIRSYRWSDATEEALKYSLKVSLKDYALIAFVRHLVGSSLSKKYPNSKILAYCEFQVVDRALYKGIRNTESNIKIYAYQQFIKYPTFMNAYISDYDLAEIIPDRIIVTGKYYMPSASKYNYMSLSIRNDRIFDVVLDCNPKAILVLLPYFSEEATHILQLIKQSLIAKENLVVRPHPALDKRVYQDLIQGHWIVNSSGDMYDVLPTTKIVITSGSGTAIEAISVGISVLVIGAHNRIPIDPMINLGKGVIWGAVDNNLDKVFATLNRQRRDNPSEIKRLSDEYKSLFFSRPQKKDILHSFNI